MPKRQQDIGKRWEREVARWLREWGYEARRSRQAHHKAKAGKPVPDIDDTPWWVECSACVVPESVQTFARRCERKWAQALDDRDEAGDPRPILVVVKSARFTGWLRRNPGMALEVFPMDTRPAEQWR